MKDERLKHESYAVLQISRTSHGGQSSLFGSSIKHQHTISLRIHPAYVTRNLSIDWVGFEGLPYIEVEMSQTQFAEAISSLNMGVGTPCTLRQLRTDKGYRNIEPPPETNKKAQLDKEFKEKAEKQTIRAKKQKANILEALKGKVSQKLYNEISVRLGSMYNDINDSLPFIKEMYTEQTERTLTEAKGEIESYLIQKINAIGVKGLKMDAPKLIGDVDEDRSRSKKKD